MGRKEGNRAARLAKVTGLVSLVGVAASGCSVDEVLRFGWPQGVTPQAEAMRQLWTWSVIAALVVGVIVWALIFWSIIFHRKKSEEFPRQFQYNGPLEFVLIGLPMIIIVVLFVFSTQAQNVVTAKDKTPDVNVKVWAFQWNWEFEYQDFKTPDGTTVRTTGSSTEIPLLVLPANKEIRYTIESKDVIHSFFVPAFHFKRDTIPYPEKNSQDKRLPELHRPGRRLRRPVRRAVRHLPRGDELRGAGAPAAGLRPVHAAAGEAEPEHRQDLHRRRGPHRAEVRRDVRPAGGHHQAVRHQPYLPQALRRDR